MTFFDRLERRIGWISFPGFLRYYALFHVLVFVLQFIRPDIGLLLQFDKDRIFSGEIWRVATMFFAVSNFGPPTLMSVVFLYFGVNFAFMVNDALEAAWGSFKATMFYYMGILLILIANFIYPIHIPLSGFALYGAAFLAFATLFPRVEILLMFFLPVQVRFLGMLEGFTILMMVISMPVLLPFILLAFANYVVFAGIPAIRGTARIIGSVQRRKRFNSAKGPASEAFHTCAACERTDATDPGLEFRVGGDGREYCEEHLPE